MFFRATYFVFCIASVVSSACGWQAPKTPSQPGIVWVDSKEIHESSGLARSRKVERLLWTHNDSGDGPRLFAFDADGRVHAVVDVTNVESVDWKICAALLGKANHTWRLPMSATTPFDANMSTSIA